jgi:hypothetical protein
LILCVGGCAFPKYETVYRQKDKEFIKTFDPNLPLISYKAINFISVEDNGLMTVSPKVISIYDELEVPRVEKSASEKKAPDPIGAVTLTVLTLGLNLFFATGETWKVLTGDSKNERVISTDVDMKRAKKTGQKIQDTSFGKLTGPIRIEGLIDGPLTLFGDKNNKYDLSTYIRPYTGYEVIKPIFITCIECQETIPNEPGITNTLRFDINIQAIHQKLNPVKRPNRPNGQPG